MSNECPQPPPACHYCGTILFAAPPVCRLLACSSLSIFSSSWFLLSLLLLLLLFIQFNQSNCLALSAQYRSTPPCNTNTSMKQQLHPFLFLFVYPFPLGLFRHSISSFVPILCEIRVGIDLGESKVVYRIKVYVKYVYGVYTRIARSVLFRKDLFLHFVLSENVFCCSKNLFFKYVSLF